MEMSIAILRARARDVGGKMNPFDDERFYTWFYRGRSEFRSLKRIVWRIFGTKIGGIVIEHDGTKIEVVTYELKGVRLIWRLKINGEDVGT